MYRRNYRWALRKLLIPLYGRGLVVDIGSGGRPHPFADIIVEKYTDTSHRFRELQADGRLVLADALHLPFKDNAFSFSLAYHVLEHIRDVKSFLNELGRVSKAGYIETPNSVYEILNPLSVHVNVVATQGDKLVIYPKLDSWAKTPGAQYRPVYNDADLQKLLRTHPEAFHTIFRWIDSPSFELRMQGENENLWFDEEAGLTAEEAAMHPISNSFQLPFPVRLFAKWMLKYRRRFVNGIFVCPRCRSDLAIQVGSFDCKNLDCGSRFPSVPVPDFRL